VRSMRMLTLTVIGACALSAAAAGSASASEFHASKLGTLKGTQLGTQTFNSGGGVPLNVECTKATTSGQVTVLLALKQLVIVDYFGCTAAGLAATVTLAHYLIFADNELVGLDNLVTITVPTAGCKVFIEPQHVKGITFANFAGKISESSNVKNIVSSGTGGTCGTGSNAGTYVGKNDVELEGGIISWKQ
jgi:hypothetical protein